MFLPVATREIVAVTRHPRFHRERCEAAMGGILMLGIALLFAYLVGIQAAGRTIFGMLAWAATISALYAGGISASTTFSPELRDGTLGLLFLTPLKNLDVLLGKIAGAATRSLHHLLVLFPVFLSCLLLGGTSAGQALSILVIALNSLFFAMAVGVFISSTQTDDRQARAFTFLILLVLSLGPMALGIWLPILTLTGIPILVKPAWLSPTFGPWSFTVGFNTTVMNPHEWIVSAVIIHLAGWCLFWMTARRIRKVALAGPPRRFGQWWKDLKKWWVYGRQEDRVARRRRFLAVHPIAWLSLRHARKGTYVWVGVVICSILFGIGYFSSIEDPSHRMGVVAAYLYAILSILKSVLHSELNSRLWIERQSGGFELILTTPTSTSDWIAGQARAIKELMLRPAAAALCISLVTLAWLFPKVVANGGSLENGVIALGVILVAVVDVVPLFWMSLFHCLGSANAQSSSQKIWSRYLLVPYSVAFIAWGGWKWVNASNPGWTQGFEFGIPTLVVLWVLLNGVLGYVAGRQAKREVLRHFHRVASEGSFPEETSTGKEPEGAGGMGGGSRAIWAVLGRAIRRHPFSVALVVLAIVPMTFQIIRRSRWENRLSLEKESLRNLMPTGADEFATGKRKSESLNEFLLEANRVSKVQVRYGKVNPYKAWGTTNATKIDEQIKPFERLVELAKGLPKGSGYPSHWASPSQLLTFVPEQVSLRKLDTVLGIRFVRACWHGESEEALQCLEGLAHLVDMEASTPSLIAMAGTSGKVLAEVAVESLNLTRGFRPPLTRLSEILARADQLERCHERLKRAPEYLLFALNEWNPSARFPGIRQLERAVDLVSIRRQERGVGHVVLWKSLLTQAYADPARLPNLVLENPQSEDVTWFAPVGTFAGHVNGGLLQGYLNQVEAIREIRCARAAVMLERYREEHGRWPGSPAEIPPAIHGGWPVDPFTLNPLIYKPETNGFRIVAGMTLTFGSTRQQQVPFQIEVRRP